MNSLGDLWEEIKANPALMGIGILLLLVGVYFIQKRMNTAAPASTSTAIDSANPDTIPKNQQVYNQTYNTYPVIQQTVVPGGTPIPTPTPIPPQPTPTPTPTPKPPPTPIPPQPTPTPTPIPQPAPKYFTATTWPAMGSSLFTIAELEHTTLAHIEALNPLSILPSHNYNIIYPGQKIRVA